MIQLPDILFSPTESALLDLLARTEGFVPTGELERALAASRGGKEGGRPLKVHLHYLRKRLAPHGIKIINKLRFGFMMLEVPAAQHQLKQSV